MAYLQAMGLETYISRAQMPGAAPTRRLAIVPVARKVGSVAADANALADPNTEGRTPEGRTPEGRTPEGRIPPPAMPDLDIGAAPSIPQLRDQPGAPAVADKPVIGTQSANAEPTVASFSMAAIVAGGLLWLEDLEARPLAKEQVQLVQAMSRALEVAGGSDQLPTPGANSVEVSQFDWPMHNNRQLGLGAEAVAASLAGFIGRRLDNKCHGLVLLGQGACSLVPVDQLGCDHVVKTTSTAAMLASPGTKAQVWQDLQSLVRR